MKKDIEWLKGRFRGRKLFKPQNDREVGYNVAIDEFSEYVDQLDEPETLSIDKEQLIKSIENYIPLYDKTVGDVVEGILEVVKQLPEMEVLSPDWIDENQHPYGGDYQVLSEKLENLLVPKQELPVIPKFVADWIVECKEIGFTIQQIFYQVHSEYKQNIMSPTSEWINENEGLFAESYLHGYEVEEEKKYYVVKREGLDGVHYYFTKFNDEMNGLFTRPNDKKGAYRFDDKEKAQAIANYTNGKVEELEE